MSDLIRRNAAIAMSEKIVDEIENLTVDTEEKKAWARALMETILAADEDDDEDDYDDTAYEEDREILDEKLHSVMNKIPEYFYFAMAGELVSIFGPQILMPIEWSFEYDLRSGTDGWCEAFKATCKKLDMSWLSDFYDTLGWYESDIFDEDIELEIIHSFCEHNHLATQENCYYKHLVETTLE